MAASKKVTGSGAVGYVIQMGAFRDQKNAEQMIDELRSAGAEVFLARKDTGIYVVQSPKFATKGKAQALAARLVAEKLINNYFITTATLNTIASRGASDDGLSKPHLSPIQQIQKKSAIDQPERVAEQDSPKAATIPVDQKSVAISAVPAVPVDDVSVVRAEAGLPEQGVFIQEFKLAKDSDSSEKYAAFVEKYDRNLKQCSMPDTFKEIASFFARKAQPGKALSVYRVLLSCSKEQESRLKILSSMKTLIPALELVAMYQQERNAASGSPRQLKKLDSFKVALLFTLLETEPEKLEEFAVAIQQLYPEDREALTVLAWYHLRNDRFEEAYKYFSELNRIEPEQADHATGMIYALAGMKGFERAMEFAPVVNSFFYNKYRDSQE